MSAVTVVRCFGSTVGVWVAGSHSLGKKRTAISTFKKTITLQPKKTIRINTYNPLSTLRIDWLLSMSMQPFVNLASVSLVGRIQPVSILMQLRVILEVIRIKSRVFTDLGLIWKLHVMHKKST
ncbi:MAG: hypothetical protein ACXW1U_21545, partial [Methylobacter sp.]